MTRNRTVTRKIVVSLLISVTLLVSAFYAQSAAAVSLKRETLITGTAITLGDVFEGLPAELADKVLGPAPQPGQDMVLNARTLLRVSLALDLPWKPTSSAEYIVLRSPASIVDQTQIKQALAKALLEQSISKRFDISWEQGPTKLVLPADQDNTVEVQDIFIKQDQNRFEATLVAPSKERPLQTAHISGKIIPIISVPVLKDTTRAGTIIGPRDIETIDVAEFTLKQDTILTAENLIGTTPRRLLNAGQPVKANEIEAPKIVERGEYITMIFKQGPLHLTARGKALEHGAKGDLIRVVNTGSNQTVEAMVTNIKEVTVQTY